ncbi:MAG: hypothetical protein U9R42_01495, partial [Bacteroidota bacterium]|nr:hypothetical protein [Bacteroidota bacterium]
DKWQIPNFFIVYFFYKNTNIIFACFVFHETFAFQERRCRIQDATVGSQRQSVASKQSAVKDSPQSAVSSRQSKTVLSRQ